MYAYLSGNVLHMETDYLILDVNGVGYQVYANAFALAKARVGDKLTVYTHLSVREDAMTLFGFLTMDEKRMFEQLIQISGIGPKAALSVLSRMQPNELAAAVFAEDVKAFKGVPGVGPKIAQRLILELKGKIDQSGLVESVVEMPKGRQNIEEAIQALVGLGYTAKEATKAVTAINQQDASVDQLIRLALTNVQ